MAQLKYADKTITLPVSPREVTWTYQLKTSAIKTYGGVVVQILAHHIDSLNISGQLPAIGNTSTKTNRFAFLDKFQQFISDAMLWQQGTGQGDTTERSLELSIPELSQYCKKSDIDFAEGFKFKVLLSSYPNIKRSIDTGVPTYLLSFDVIESTSPITALTKQDARYKQEIGNLSFSSGVHWTKNQYNNPLYTATDPGERIPSGEVISDNQRQRLWDSMTETFVDNPFTRTDEQLEEYDRIIKKLQLKNGGVK